MTHAALVFYFIFATLVQLGGVIGFVKAKSKASLIAGLVSGLLLDLAGILLLMKPENPRLGLFVGLIVTILLLARFAPAFFKTKKFMPAGLIFFLGIMSIGITVSALSAL